MNTINVDKQDLLTTLRTNRADHVKDFALTWEAYRVKVVQTFQGMATKARDAAKGSELEVRVDMPAPEDHTADYDRAIAMLEWHTADSIGLQEHEFRQYVQDEWDWRRRAEMHNFAYTGHASPSKVGI